MRARLFGLICLAALIALGRPAAAAEEPRKPALPSQGGGKDGDTLSETLDRQNGVLKPKPDVDPQAEKPPPTPNPDSMPVIRPPTKPGTEAK